MDHKPVVFTTVFVVSVFLSFWLLYRLRLTVFLVFVAILIGIALAELFGVIGVVLTPLLAVAVQILFQQLYPTPPRSFSQEMLERAETLKGQLVELKGNIRRSTAPEVAVLIDRMDRLAKRTIDYIQED